MKTTKLENIAISTMPNATDDDYLNKGDRLKFLFNDGTSIRGIITNANPRKIYRASDGIIDITFDKNITILNKYSFDIYGKNKLGQYGIIAEGYINENRETNVNLKKGDIIWIQSGPIRHYGIYVSKSEIIHYASTTTEFKDENIIVRLIKEGPLAVIHKTTLEKFLGECEYGIQELDELGFSKRIFSKEKRYSPDETVRRARSRIGTNQDEYNIASHNCEHFAYWCKTGVPQSHQVEIVGNALKIGGSFLPAPFNFLSQAAIEAIKHPKDF